MICGKHIYRTRAEATATLDGVNADKRPTRANNQPKYTYYCEDCNGWHATSKHKAKPHVPKNQSKDFSKPIKPRKPGSLIIRNFTSKGI